MDCKPRFPKVLTVLCLLMLSTSTPIMAQSTSAELPVTARFDTRTGVLEVDCIRNADFPDSPYAAGYSLQAVMDDIQELQLKTSSVIVLNTDAADCPNLTLFNASPQMAYTQHYLYIPELLILPGEAIFRAELGFNENRWTHISSLTILGLTQLAPQTKVIRLGMEESRSFDPGSWLSEAYPFPASVRQLGAASIQGPLLDFDFETGLVTIQGRAPGRYVLEVVFMKTWELSARHIIILEVCAPADPLQPPAACNLDAEKYRSGPLWQHFLKELDVYEATLRQALTIRDIAFLKAGKDVCVSYAGADLPEQLLARFSGEQPALLGSDLCPGFRRTYEGFRQDTGARVATLNLVSISWLSDNEVDVVYSTGVEVHRLRLMQVQGLWTVVEDELKWIA